MATLINGNGNPAVYANQDADLIASICGDTTCISAVGSQFAATQEDANTIGLADGVIITKEGRRIQLDAGYTDLFTIPTGTAGTTSYYIIGYKLTTGSDSKQTCETFVQKMNSSSETITEDTFRGGASDVYVSVYRVVQDGLNIDSINGLLPTLSLGAQTSSSHSGSGSTVTTTLAANKTLDEVTQQMLNNDYALKSALSELENNTLGTPVSLAANTPYTATADGYLACRSVSSQGVSGTINSLLIFEVSNYSGTANDAKNVFFVKKGMTINITWLGTGATATFYPLV